MFDLTEMGTVLGVWFVAYEARDLLVVAWQETPLSAPQARWRIRTYHPDSTDPWDEQDEKAWYDLRLPPGDETDLVPQLQQWIAQIRETWHEPTALVDELLGPVSPPEVVTWLQSPAWTHEKLLPPGDPDAETVLAQRRAARAPEGPMTDGLERLRYAWGKADVEARVAFMRELYDRSAEGSGVVEVQAMVGGATGEPMVELRWDDKILQWSPETAIEHAMGLVEAAEGARHDAWFAQFMQQILGTTFEEAMHMLLEMRVWRQRRNELPEDPEGPTG